MKTFETDVLIVGAGPAGCACATVLASAGARVAIVESGNLDGMRIGETIAPAAKPLLRRLGIDMSAGREWMVPCGVISAWGGPQATEKPSMMNPYGRGWRVDRNQFDRMLLGQALAAGASVWLNSQVTRVRLEADCWFFSIQTSDSNVEGTAPWVVEATGRTGRSSFAPSNARIRWDDLIGLGAITEMMQTDDAFGFSCLVESTVDGWWYSAPLPNRKMIVVFFTDGDLLPRGRSGMPEFLSERLRAAPLTSQRASPTAELFCTWRAFDASTTIRRMGATTNWVAVGDALAALDPLSGQGITLALRGGVELADCLLLNGRARTDAVANWLSVAVDSFNRRLQEQRAFYGMETRWSTWPFWSRRTMSEEVQDTAA